MSANIKQIFDANPTTTFNADDLFYLGRNPYGPTEDFGFSYSTLAAQFTSSTLGSANFYLGNGSNQAAAVSMSGDASMDNSGAVTLSNTAVTPGTYSVNGQSIFDVDSKGRITSASNATVSADPVGSAGGDLSGSYPNPNVDGLLGNAITSATPTAGHVLIGNTTGWENKPIGNDASLSSTGELTVSSTGGVAFSASATTDTTSANNISSGTLPNGRLTGVYSGITGLGNQSQNFVLESNSIWLTTDPNHALRFSGAGSEFDGVAINGPALYGFEGGALGTTITSENISLFWDSSQNVVLNTDAVSTTATDGFLYIASCAGEPTGTPTSFTGRNPVVWDSTNNSLQVYNGGWKDPVGNELLTYTPTIGDGTNNFTTSTATGHYIVTGRVVNFFAYVVWTSKGSASGTIKLSLPLMASASVDRFSFDIGFNTDITFTDMLVGEGSASTPTLNLVNIISGGTSGFITDADVGASGQLQVGGAFFID